MSRYGKRPHTACCQEGGDCGDCDHGGAPHVTERSHLPNVTARSQLWPLLTRVLLILGLLVAAFAAGTLGCAFFDFHDAHAQQLQIDTTSQMYKSRSAQTDSLVINVVAPWMERLRFPGWRVVVRADTLAADTIAQVWVREDLRTAVMIVDMRVVGLFDVNVVVVHELHHIKLAPYTHLARVLASGHQGILDELLRREETLIGEMTRVTLQRWRQ